ncbi:MAG: 50S ribosomal protein L3 [Candidatus Omnitrophica bacterium]|jgi:large subunit ribosomal protein L3|nr:50S ribosomal protein L3 [Candidatus Omnitrophota bacterium]
MLREIYGKKIGMSQLFDAKGNFLPVTLLEVEPVCVLEKMNYPQKTKIKIGCFKVEGKKVNKLSKPLQGYFGKIGLGAYALVREVEAEKNANFSLDSKLTPEKNQKNKAENKDKTPSGEDVKKEDSQKASSDKVSQEQQANSSSSRMIGVDIFKEGELVDVRARTKGRGFAGGVKRHGWYGQPKSHGSMTHRRIGSAGAYPAEIVKGLGMPGHMGNAFRTSKKLEVLKVDKDKNLLFIKGCVPGPIKSVVCIKKVA